MIPADALNSLKALALAQKPLVTATSAAAGAASTFEPGQKFQATVQAQLAPGVFRVKVADQLLQLQLPATIRTGDTITLQVVSLLPRLTFNMAASANPLSTSDQLSETSRLLSSLTQQPLEKSFVRPTNSAPLWTGATQLPDTTELADNLHTALSQSGLFYESHQAQWLAGSRNTSQLLQEPQNQPPRNINSSSEKTDQTHVGGNEPAQESSIANAGRERTPLLGIPEHLQPLVQQQLSALETRQVHWQGQVWPNQEMSWKIQEQPSKSPTGGDERLWATQIHLNLPNLGAVTATLHFAGNGLIINLDSDNGATRSKMGKASSTLIAAMTDRGINITSALVTQHDNS